MVIRRVEALRFVFYIQGFLRSFFAENFFGLYFFSGRIVLAFGPKFNDNPIGAELCGLHRKSMTKLINKENQIIQNKFYGLDHLRAFAICFVFVYHYKIISLGFPEWFPQIFKFGWTGVDLFFVLSGFLISSQLFLQIKKGDDFSFKEFFLKRAFRILPAFWVVIAIYFFFPIFREKESLPEIWKFLTFTQNLGLNLRHFGTFSHAWSLCVEEHFYLFFPLILLLLQITGTFKKSYWILIALFILGFGIRSYSWETLYLPLIEQSDAWIYWYQYIYYPTYNRLDGLLIGVAIAAIYVFLPNSWNKISKYGNLSFILSLAILTMAYYLCEEVRSYSASVFGFPLVAVGYGFMVSAAISPTCFLYKWNSNVTTFIAAMSYGIYLTHKGVIHLTQQIFIDFEIEPDSTFMFLLCIFFCTIAAVLLHWTIEKPFMRLRKRLIEPKHQSISPVLVPAE